MNSAVQPLNYLGPDVWASKLRLFLTRVAGLNFCSNSLIKFFLNSFLAMTRFIYLIVPFWYASAAYQASQLVEPWFVFWRDAVEPKYPWRDQTSLICRRSVPKRYDELVTVHKFSPKFSVTVAESGQWLDIVGYQDSRVGFWLAHCEFGYGEQSKQAPSLLCTPEYRLLLCFYQA